MRGRPPGLRAWVTVGLPGAEGWSGFKGGYSKNPQDASLRTSRESQIKKRKKEVTSSQWQEESVYKHHYEPCQKGSSSLWIFLSNMIFSGLMPGGRTIKPLNTGIILRLPTASILGLHTNTHTQRYHIGYGLECKDNGEKPRLRWRVVGVWRQDSGYAYGEECVAKGKVRCKGKSALQRGRSVA